MASPLDPVIYSHVLSPAPKRFPMSHAPYLAPIGENHVAVIWFAGSREWAKDVHIMSAVFSSESGTWTSIRDFVSDIGYSLGNAVMLNDEAGGIHLWYVRTKGYWQDGEIVHMVMPHLEGGFTSREPLPLAAGWLVRGRPLQKGSQVYLPVYHETANESGIWEQDLTTGKGVLRETVTGPGGLIQPTLVEFENNEFRFFMRNPRRPNRIHFAYSMNRGQTWSRPFPTTLPNPNAGLDVVRLTGSRLLCVYNDSERHRYPLSLAISENGGVEWEKIHDLEINPGEYSYPSLLLTGEGLHLAYTYQREAIRFVTLNREQF